VRLVGGQKDAFSCVVVCPVIVVFKLANLYFKLLRVQVLISFTPSTFARRCTSKVFARL
jgi:hypothetical protein